MKALIIFIQNHRNTLWWISLVLCLAMVVVMLDSGKCLKTPESPKGIVSLELTFRKQKAQRLKNSWDTLRCFRGEVVPASALTGDGEDRSVTEIAVTDTRLDYLFIITYTFLFVVMIVRKDRGPVTARTRFFVWLALAAMVLDSIENILMIRFLEGESIHSAWFATAALLKFTAILAIALYLLATYMKRLSDFFSGFGGIVWTNRVSVTGLVIIYFALWKSDQGQDLLLNLNANDVGPALFYFVLTVLAAINWFLPKYYTVDFMNRASGKAGLPVLFLNPSPLASGNETNVPRIMGILTFLVPACAILNALRYMKIGYDLDGIPPMGLLVASTLFYIWLIDRNYLDIACKALQKKGLGFLFLALILALLACIIFFGVINRGAPHQLANLSIGLFMMSMIFAIITSLRMTSGFYEVRGLQAFLNQLRLQPASRWVMITGLACVLIFWIVTFVPVSFASWSYSRFLTLPIVFTGIIFYTFFFFVLLIMGKYSGINWAAIVIVAGLLMAVFVDNRFHDIYRLDDRVEPELQTLDSYIDNWMTARFDEIEETANEPYPVYIINTYGGGIRAAAWTSLVVSHLDEITNGEFQRHVFAYSGASGGTVGAAVMCALRKSGKDSLVHSDQLMEFYRNDFLTPVLVGLLGRDVFFSITGWDAVDDRARLQDDTWEAHLYPLDSGVFGQDFSALWYGPGSRQYDVPLLFANTYHVESGLKGIIAPVKLSPKYFPQAVDVNGKLGDFGIPLSTASFLSARFPYISPAGKLDSGHHFLDGGLKENSGAETAFELYTLLKEHRDRKLADSTRLKKESPRLLSAFKKMRVFFISLNNTGIDDPDPATRNLVEFTAPVTALYNNWVGNTLKADQVLSAQMGENYCQLRPLKDKITIDDIGAFQPVLPLGWQISDFALRRLHESLTYCDPARHPNGDSNPHKIKELLGLIGDFTVPRDCNHADPDDPKQGTGKDRD